MIIKKLTLKFYKKIIVFFVSITLILILSIIFLFDFTNINSFSKIKIENEIAQGIECIDDTIFILTHSGNVFTIEKEKVKKIFSLKKLDRSNEKQINFLAHTTSMDIIDNKISIFSNALLRLPSRIVEIDYKKLLDTGYVTDHIIRKQINYNNDRAIFFEKIKINEKIFFLLSKKDRYKNDVKYSVIDKKFENNLCNVDLNDNMQNFYWDEKNNLLYISKNSFGNIGGKILKYKTDNSSIAAFCQNIEHKSTIYLSTFLELEGFTYCDDSKNYIFTNSENSFLYTEKI